MYMFLNVHMYTHPFVFLNMNYLYCRILWIGASAHTYGQRCTIIMFLHYYISVYIFTGEPCFWPLPPGDQLPHQLRLSGEPMVPGSPHAGRCCTASKRSAERLKVALKMVGATTWWSFIVWENSRIILCPIDLDMSWSEFRTSKSKNWTWVIGGMRKYGVVFYDCNAVFIGFQCLGKPTSFACGTSTQNRNWILEHRCGVTKLDEQGVCGLQTVYKCLCHGWNAMTGDARPAQHASDVCGSQMGSSWLFNFRGLDTHTQTHTHTYIYI